LQSGVVVASLPNSITFASRFKKNYDSQKSRMQINSCFQIFMLRLFLTWVLRYAAHT